jgi:hypothetical protein
MLAGVEGMAGAASVMGPGGLILGGGLLAATAGMEVYNNFFKPEDRPDVTASNIGTETQKEWARETSLLKYNDAKYGDKFTNQPKGQKQLNLGEWVAAKVSGYEDTSKQPDDQELYKYMSPDEQKLFDQQADDDRLNKLNDQVNAVSRVTLEDKSSLQKAQMVQKRFGGGIDNDLLKKVSEAAMPLGLGSDEDLQQGAAYASEMGYSEGTPDFKREMYDLALETNPMKRAAKKNDASIVSRYGGQLQATMGKGEGFVGLGAQLEKSYGIDNQAKAGAFGGIISGMQSQGANLAPWMYDQMGSIVRDNNPFVASTIGNAMQSYMSGGGTQANTMSFGMELSSAGMSSQEASIFGQMAQGDMGAYSHQAWVSGNMGNAFQDKAGRNIFEHNGAVGMQMYNNWAPKLGTGDGQMSSAQFLGTSNAEINTTFNEGGFYGLQRLSSQKSYEASMASIGVQMKGIALQEQYNWGQDDGGTWNNPTSGSSWGIEDRQTAAQRSSQQANFSDQWKQMQLSNQFGIARENNQFTRMNVNNEYQNAQFSAQYNQFQQGQQWTQQDWQYQDTTHQLNFGWQMEDINENIRFASGRQRKDLVKQRDRAALTENLSEDNTDTQRERQKQLWAQQEEQYAKQKTYMAQMQQLDLESFNINKSQRETFFKMDVETYSRHLKEYEAETKLQDELKELQRKYQYDQIQLQKEAAGAQASAAAAQKLINDAITTGSENAQKNIFGPFAEMNKYDNAFRITQASTEMFRMMNNVDATKIDKLMSLIRAISTASTGSGGSGQDPRAE